MKDDVRAEQISHHLNSEYPSHSYPITLKAGRIGLHVRPLKREIHDLLLKLNGLYSEMGQKAITDSDDFNYHADPLSLAHPCLGPVDSVLQLMNGLNGRIDLFR